MHEKPDGKSRRLMIGLQMKRWDASAANVPPVLAYAGFLSVWIVIQTAKPTENIAQPMDDTSEMMDILFSPR